MKISMQRVCWLLPAHQQSGAGRPALQQGRAGRQRHEEVMLVMGSTKLSKREWRGARRGQRDRLAGQLFLKSGANVTHACPVRAVC